MVKAGSSMVGTPETAAAPVVSASPDPMYTALIKTFSEINGKLHKREAPKTETAEENLDGSATTGAVGATASNRTVISHQWLPEDSFETTGGALEFLADGEGIR